MQNQLSLLERFQAPTSPFFQPVVKWGYWLSALCAAIATFHQELNTAGIPVPVIVSKAAEIAAYVLAAIATMSTFTVDFEALKKGNTLGK